MIDSSTAATAAELFRLIDRPVWIVTAASGGLRSGLLATWVLQSSLDAKRPRLIAGLAPNHFTTELAVAAGCFAVHLLAPDQAELALGMAIGSGRDRDKFAGIEHGPTPLGCPRLARCLAWAECRVVTTYDLGDRLLLVANLSAAGRVSTGTPLCESGVFAAASAEHLTALKADLQRDIELQRPLSEHWLAQYAGST